MHKLNFDIDVSITACMVDWLNLYGVQILILVSSRSQQCDQID